MDGWKRFCWKPVVVVGGGATAVFWWLYSLVAEVPAIEGLWRLPLRVSRWWDVLFVPLLALTVEAYLNFPPSTETVSWVRRVRGSNPFLLIGGGFANGLALIVATLVFQPDVAKVMSFWACLLGGGVLAIGVFVFLATWESRLAELEDKTTVHLFRAVGFVLLGVVAGGAPVFGAPFAYAASIVVIATIELAGWVGGIVKG